MLRWITACALVVVFTSTLLLAQTRRPEAALEAHNQRVVRQWYAALENVDQLLVDGKPEKAYRKVSRLLRDMTERITSGEGVPAILSTALVLRALAAVQLGESEEGIWHWQIAQQLFPQVADYRMTAYGDAGEFLKRHPVRQPIESNAPAEGSPAIDPPVKIHAPTPDFPRARLDVGHVAIVAETMIGVDGRMRDPRILQSKGELTLVCETFDTLRRWEFQPARLDGEPVAVLYQLTVNFASSRGDLPARDERR